MERDDLVERLTNAAAGLRGLTAGPFAKWFDRVVLEEQAMRLGERRLGVERLYEILCYLLFVANIPSAIKVSLLAKGRHVRLPHKPGKKGNFAFFRVECAGRTYDLCNGTGLEAEEASQPEEHPDISLQEVPAGIIHGIWDAKYTKNGRLGKDAVQQMTYWFNALRIAPPQQGDVLSLMCPTCFEISAVLTNAPKTGFNSAVMRRLGFGFVFSFDGSSVSSAAVPSRSDLLCGSAGTSSLPGPTSAPPQTPP